MVEVHKIAVIGSGAMGRQIGMAAAVAGYDAVVQDISADAVEAAEQDMKAWAAGRVSKGRMSQEEVDAALGRLRFTTDQADAVGDADLVIEAATERLDIKRQVFTQIDELAPEHAILATNSSTYGSSSVADATRRPEKVCNMHFFNPALVMKAVEVVRHPETSDDTVDSVIAVIQKMGKHPVVLNAEIPGFIANRLMGAVRTEALNLVEQGIASIEDIDTVAKSALGHPMGPFELMDLVGLDVTYLIRKATFELTGDESEAPHPLITAKYEAGELGRKSGKGWYTYD
ncbi:3-hydroxyacyl-CoA dehydrogenase, NAD binding domain protein [Corynebacterium efficiens YS-314]|uniref:Putative 3-hydroxyacyl-CoA dehydrogenase n=1 Tax=Corynebacterium efficiens (strain DSM 44549 / YS-314 / AJ 12310 / JCM 11189 / NBRC 100395) TaxID=196164 RepID=Q8FLT5_COREF|nr:3-hydroxyacyl-CoA dehydrogenase family protein [Corynebacterium efficiens]EEW51303.1 3-hydroxyacyl-CoA dehydrogenase, NAD binding domain protein [Corynebacterium efficiens YS-314]BAC19585.1 putative 3-hydroxyacyl-CoA dehydrogenase [Corynebacterium efficiens YS-314]